MIVSSQVIHIYKFNISSGGVGAQSASGSQVSSSVREGTCTNPFDSWRDFMSIILYSSRNLVLLYLKVPLSPLSEIGPEY